MDKKQVLEQLVKGLKQIKDDLEKKEVKESIGDMKTAVAKMKESVGNMPSKEKMCKDLNAEITKKVNTPAAMGKLKANAAAKNAAAKPEPQLPPSNEATKKVMKNSEDEETTKDESSEKKEPKKGFNPFAVAKNRKKEGTK